MTDDAHDAAGTDRARGRSTAWAVASIAVVLVLTAVLVALASRSEVDASRSGVVVTYDGREYWVSDLQVADTALGDELAADVPFQGTTADVRAIDGQDPAVAVAAYLPPLSQASPTAGWRLVSTDPAYWTDQANVEANASLFVQP